MYFDFVFVFVMGFVLKVFWRGFFYLVGLDEVLGVSVGGVFFLFVYEGRFSFRVFL